MIKRLIKKHNIKNNINIMSKKNIINKVIQDNFKINILENNDNNQTNEKLEDDNSFNKLLSLQLLIQKHSGLKELCK